jgi:hypothetical protein
MSNGALQGFILGLVKSDARYYRLALAREINNHLFLLSTLGKSSGELNEGDMEHILGRFMIALKTLNLPEEITRQSPVGPEAYAPKKVRSEMVNALEAELQR